MGDRGFPHRRLGLDVRVEPNDPPRTFRVGRGRRIEISDCGTVHLEPDEQVTFVTAAGAEYDVARKDWGFYATPSLDSRLPDHGLRPALVRNREDRHYVLLVESGRERSFDRYLRDEDLSVVAWLDDSDLLSRLAPRHERD